MKKLIVIAPPDEPEFASFAEAISATRQNPRHSSAEQTTSVIRGLTVLSASYGRTSVDLALSGRRVLHIYLDGGLVCWQLRAGVADGAHSKTADYETDLLLEFGNSTLWYYWECRKILRELVGRPVQLLSASPAWLYLTIQDAPTLMFSRLTMLEDNQDLLFYAPE
jgi:hypothetical protein